METLEMTKYIADAIPCKNTVKDAYKGVILKDNWKRILWQEFDSKDNAIEWAQEIINKEYK